MPIHTVLGPIEASELGPTTMKLPSTGLTIDLPTGWVARDTVFKVSNAPKGAPGTDLITRVAPTSPLLFFTLVSFGGHTCAEWSSQIGAGASSAILRKSARYVASRLWSITISGALALSITTRFIAPSGTA